MKKLALASIAAMALAPMAMAGGSWDETADGGGDAGDTAGTAQVVNGSGDLITITGQLAPGGESADLYIIRIKDLDTFGFSVEDINFDPQTWMFDLGGNGIVHNDDFNGLRSEITNQAADNGAHGAGDFVIGVSAFNSDPLDGGGDAIFSFSTYPGPDPQQRMPNAGVGPVVSWTGDTDEGRYTITLTGVSYVPAPGALALLGVAGLIGRRRKRA